MMKIFQNMRSIMGREQVIKVVHYLAANRAFQEHFTPYVSLGDSLKYLKPLPMKQDAVS